ncbi:putative serine-rich protein C1E8.05 [Gossypium australe]|uniref:Putative serine-rich protein C1E8.05 n=1 Tax=Gossypium australe TaxID=47621 RepID=A0A5B6VSJ8_9ROSI|nr:putative serine-rich protein C1E8.05 [Gossypium australe]
MATFPSPVERTVASALLLLSTQPPKLTIGCSDGETKGETNMSEKNKLRLMPSNESESCSSSLTSHQLSSRKQQKLRIIAAVACCHEIKLKVSLPYSVSPLFAVVKRRRSKICWSSDDRKTSSFKPLISGNMATAETTSCLSSSSSGISSARSQQPKSTTSKAEKIRRKRRIGGSNHMRCRAEAILKLLSGGCFAEVNIRRMLGDSPDTSKALRMYTPVLFLLFATLLKKEEVKRSGTGGQKDPYIYTIVEGQNY